MRVCVCSQVWEVGLANVPFPSEGSVRLLILSSNWVFCLLFWSELTITRGFTAVHIFTMFSRTSVGNTLLLLYTQTFVICFVSRFGQ